MSSAAAREILVFGAYATVFALVGFLSLLAAIRWRSARRASLLLAWAMALHAVTLLSGSGAVRVALGGPSIVWTWVTVVGGYVIAFPWAFLVEEIAGAGWKSSIRRVRQAFGVWAAGATLFDLVNGRPASFPAFVQPLVISIGASTFLANLVFGGVRLGPEVRIVRAGYVAFMVAVIHDDIVALGLTPWGWQTGQLGVLTFVASLVYTIITRAVREQAQLRSIDHELAMAHGIQQALMPPAPPALDTASIAFRHVPAASVAGDLFQFLGAEPDRVGLLVADVSGHGVPAALIASMVKVAAAAQRVHVDDPDRVLGGIYGSIADELPPGLFVTAVYVFVDLRRGILRHASAGHPPALIRRAADGCVVPLGCSGPLMMSFVPPAYPVSEVSIEPGDRVVLYTDGLVEAMRADGEMFGAERLAAVAVQAPAGPDAFIDAAFAAASAFRNRDGAPFDDDCTMVILEVDGLRRMRQSPP